MSRWPSYQGLSMVDGSSTCCGAGQVGQGLLTCCLQGHTHAEASVHVSGSVLGYKRLHAKPLWGTHPSVAEVPGMLYSRVW